MDNNVNIAISQTEFTKTSLSSLSRLGPEIIVYGSGSFHGTGKNVSR